MEFAGSKKSNTILQGLSKPTMITPYEMGTVQAYPSYTGDARSSHTTAGGFGGGTPSNRGYSYAAKGLAPTSNLSMDQLVSQYSPEQLGKMDFSGYEAGSLGTNAPVSSGFGDYAGLANAGINAFNAYNQYTMGNKQLDMAKDKFNFEKAYANANYTNQAKLTNNQIQNAGEVGMGLAGNTMDANARAARQAQMDTSKVRETI